ncbi:hypothetical protein PRNP1_007380 [Phytophthora ramorum]
MMRSAADVSMGAESKREDDEEMGDVPPHMVVGFSTPKSARRKPQTKENFEFSVTPEPSRRRLSTSRGRQPPSGLEESPARYSPSKVKAAVRSFADFLHFLEQEEHQAEHTLMPVIIQRFAELGAVIESQKRHIDRWKGKELDLAIEEAQQNMELVRGLGEILKKKELELAADKVEKQKWEEKYQLAAQEVESLKKQGTYQIQQLRSEVSMLRQAGVEVETKLKERDASLASMRKANEKIQSQLKQMEHDSSVIIQENTTLKQQGAHQSDEMRSLEQQMNELREHYETVVGKATELEQDVSAWQAKYERKEHEVSELEDAFHHDRQEMGAREGNLEHLIAENRKLQEHANRIAQEHEQQLAELHGHRNEADAERQRITQSLQQESARFQKLKKEAGEMQAQIEAQAMSAMQQREQQLLDEKSRVEEELQHQFSKINQENIELRAKVDSLKDINRRKSTEMSRLMAISQEAEQQHHSRNVDIQRIQQLTEEIERAKRQIETLSKDMAARNAAHTEAMKSQSTEFENQYNDFVAQVEGQFNDMTRENEQLRADLDEASKTVGLHEGRTSADGEELGKWRTECENLQHQLHEGARENDSLKRELEHRVQELELKNKENAELNAHIQQFLSPDNERTREVELLQMERARLEEQNLELQRLIDSTRAEIDTKLDEAHQEHIRSRDQETAYQNEIRSLYTEKEDMNRNIVALSSEKSTLEFQISSARNEIEHWKTSAQLLEKDKHELELRIQEVMRQATEQIESQKQTTAIATEDGRIQLQRLTSQLVQRDTQMNEGHQQLLTLQENVRSLEEKLRAQQYEFESLQLKNEQMTVQLESLHQEKRGLEKSVMQLGTSFLREGQLGLEGDLAQRLEQMAHEMELRIQEESEKVNQLQAVLDSTQDEQQQHFNEEFRKLEEENVGLQQRLEEYSAHCDKLDAELLQLHREREERDRTLDEMQQTIAAHEEEKWARNNATGDLKRLEAVHRELEATHEQFKKHATADLKEKEKKVAELEDDMAELQSKLDQEKEMSRHLMDRSHAEKQEYAELSKNSQIVEEQKARVEELEASVEKLQHKLQVNEQSKAGKRQNSMHENLQKERELRSLQARYDSLDAENAATLKKMDAKVEEVDHLHQEIGQLHEEIEQLNEEIRDNTTEMDNARGHLHVSEQLTMKLEEMQDELAAREGEARQHEAELAAKEDELLQARGAENDLKRELEDTLRQKESEVSSLTQQNAQFRVQLKRVAQAKLSSKNSAAADSESRQVSMRELEEAYEQSVRREQDLASQIAHLEDAKSTMLSQFRREMRKLNIEFSAQGSNGNYVDDSAFHRGILEISALLRSYQDREARQDALIHRKEKQIDELKLRLDEFEHSLHPRGSELKRQDRQQRRDVEGLFHQQLDAMSEEVSKLKVENRELRDNHRADQNEETSAEPVREWEEKCAKLKHRVRELKDTNSKLKESRFSKADMKALVKEVESLTGQVLEKDMQLEAFRKRETSRLKNDGAATAATGSRRSRDLLIALQEKEDKIMVLNDHLTGLMTENMRLQHSTEQYAVRYGALEGSTTNGVIGNSGIRARTNGSSQQPPAVRSQ